MRKTLSTLICLVAAAGLARADIVKFYNGQERRVPAFSYADDRLVTPDGKAIPRGQIKEIAFEHQQPQAAGAVAKQLPQGVRELLQLARQQQAKYPDAAGILLEDDGVFTLKPDGANSYRYHFRGLVLKDEKKREWGQRSLYFDDKRERAKLLWARTIRPDGQVVEVDPATAKVSEPAGRSGHFGRGKIFSFTMAQVDVGCIVEYCYEVEEFDPFDPEMFFPGFYFQGDDPVTHSKLTVVVPNDKELNYQARHMPPGTDKPAVTRSPKSTAYVWEVSDVAPMIPEPRMPPQFAVLPNVRCSLFKTWDYLFDWMAKFQKRRMAVTPEIEQAVAMVTKGAKTTEEKVARLYYFVQQHIRYVSIKGSIGSGWSGHPATFTLKNKYGDCIDKAIIFGTLLKAIGVESEPVVVMTNNRDEDDRKLPTMRGNHAISHVTLDGRSFYLDATSTVHRYPSFSAGDHGVTAINALRREIGFVQVPPPEANCRNYALTVTAAANGDVEVDYLSDYVGDYEARVRAYYMYTQPNDHPRALANMLSAMSPKAKLERFRLANVHDISKPFAIRMWYRLPDYVVTAGQLRIFGVPGIEQQFPEAALPKRKFAINYSTSLKTVRRITILVPPSYKAKYLPLPIDLKTDYATYQARYDRQGQKIVFTSTMRRPKRIVPAADYAAYRAFLQQIGQYTKEQMFFEVEAH